MGRNSDLYSSTSRIFKLRKRLTLACFWWTETPINNALLQSASRGKSIRKQKVGEVSFSPAEKAPLVPRESVSNHSKFSDFSVTIII